MARGRPCAGRTWRRASACTLISTAAATPATQAGCDPERRQHREADEHRRPRARGVRRAAARPAVGVPSRGAGWRGRGEEQPVADVLHGDHGQPHRRHHAARSPANVSSGTRRQGQQVGQVGDRQQQRRGVRQPDAGVDQRPRADQRAGRGRHDDGGQQHDGRVQAQQRGGQRGGDERERRASARGRPRPARATSAPTAAKTPVGRAHLGDDQDRGEERHDRQQQLRPGRRRRDRVQRADGEDHARGQRRRSATSTHARRVHEGDREQDDEGSHGEDVDDGGGTAEDYAPARPPVGAACEDGHGERAGAGGTSGRSAGWSARWSCWSLLIVGWVGFRALDRRGPRRPGRGPSTTPGRAGRASAPRRFDLVAPPRLPDGLARDQRALHRRAAAAWHLGVLTDEGRYVGLEQGDGRSRDMVEEYVDEAPTRGEPVDVGGRALVDVDRRRGRPGAGAPRRRRPPRSWSVTTCPRDELVAYAAEPALGLVVGLAVGGDRRVEPLLGAVEPLPGRSAPAARRAPTAPATPRGRAALLEPAHHLDQLLAGLLVARLLGGRARSCGSSWRSGGLAGSASAVSVTTTSSRAVGDPDLQLVADRGLRRRW